MACDASKALSTLQARASETDDPEALAASLAAALLDAFTRASHVLVWWYREGDLVAGPGAGHEDALEGARRDPEPVRAAILAAEDRAVAEVVREPYGTRGPSARVVAMIRSMGAIVGAIDVASDEDDAFGEIDRCILRVLADSFGGLVGAAG